MGLVHRITVRKHLRVLRDADLQEAAELAEARRRISVVGASLLPSLLEMVGDGIDHAPLEDTLCPMITDATLGRVLEALFVLDGPPADLLERVLSRAGGYDPLPLLGELDTAGASRPRIERILRARGPSLGWDGIRRALTGASRDRVRVILGMLETRPEPQAVQVVLPLLCAEDPWVRIRALRFLGARGATSAGPEIVARLEDRDPGVRREAVQALAAIRSSEHLAPLCQSLRDPDLQVSASAIAALVAIGDPGAVRHLIGVLKDESEYARRGAVEVLNEVATPEAIQDLVQALQDEDWWVRVRAADALGALGGDRVVDAILTLVECDDVFVRRYAIEILNAIPSERSVPALLTALDDADWWVRERAVDALGKTADPRAVSSLENALRADGQLAGIVLGALGRIGDETALRAIVGFLDGGEESVVEVARKTLRELAKSSPAVEVRRGAARALSGASDGSEWGRPQGHHGGTRIPAREEPGMFRSADATRIEPVLPGVTRIHPDPSDGDTRLPSRSPQLPASATNSTQTPHPASATNSTQTPHPASATNSTQTLHPASATNSTQTLHPASATNSTQTPHPASATVRSSSGPTREPGEGRELSLSDYPSLPIGALLLDRYTVVRKVGEGGFGYVYLVMDGSVGEEIILKILSPQISLDETMIQRFVQELRYNRRIVHPNVIRLYDFLELHPGHAISMEYFPSADLGTLLRREKIVEPGRLLRITEQVCHGLKAAHDSGIVHRDIKPPNVLIGEEDRVKIVDFGLAAASDPKQSRVTKSGVLVGTPQYMAPEQIRGTDVDVRTDIYSLGTLLFECLVGHPPFASANPVDVLMMHLSDPVPSIREMCPDLPEALAWLVERSLCKDPADRPQSVDEVLAELERRAA